MQNEDKMFNIPFKYSMLRTACVWFWSIWEPCIDVSIHIHLQFCCFYYNQDFFFFFRETVSIWPMPWLCMKNSLAGFIVLWSFQKRLCVFPPTWNCILKDWKRVESVLINWASLDCLEVMNMNARKHFYLKHY